MKREFENIKYFILNNIGMVVCSLILTFIIYLVKITTPAIGMDTNQYLYDSNVYTRHWLSIGRAGQVLLKKIFWRNNANFILWNILGIFIFIIAIIYFVYLLQKITKLNKNDFFIPTLLILSSPLFVFQFYFVLQIFEFSICLLFVLFSVHIIEFTNINNIIKSIMVAVLLGISFGVYNTFVLFYTVVIAAIQLVKIIKAINEKQEYRLSKVIKEYVIYALYCILGIISYFILNKIALWHYDVQQVSHASNLVHWNTLSINDGVNTLVRSIYHFFFLPGRASGLLFYNISDTLCLIMVLYGIISVAMKNSKLLIHAILASLLLILSGLGIVFATTSFDLARIMVPHLPFMIAIGIFWGFTFIDFRVIKVFTVFILSLIIFIQVRDSSDLVVAEKMTYQEDYTKMVEIDMSIKNLQLDDLDSKRVIITGFSPSRNKFVKGYSIELIGVSMLHFGYFDDPNIHSYYLCENTLDIMSLYGMNYQKPTLEEYQKALKLHPELLTSSKSLSVFNEGDYIFVHIK